MQRRLGWLAAVVLTAVTASACANIDISGGGQVISPINPSGKTAHFNLAARTVCDTGGTTCDPEDMTLTQVNGSFKDLNTSDAYPNGVSLSFSGKLAVSELHSLIGGASVVCNPLNDALPQTAPSEGDTLCFAGLVSYRSTDLRNYPNNSTATNCINYNGALDEWIGRPSSKTAISGLAFIGMVDSDHNGKPSKGDGMQLVTLCGPYANLTKANVNGGSPFNFATCPNGRIPSLGFVNFNGVGNTYVIAIILLGAIFNGFDFDGECMTPLVSGNLIINTTSSTSPSTSTSPPPPPTTIPI